MTEYHVGQEVYILNINSRVKDGELPEVGEVVKVGRTLVTVKSKLYDWAREEQYRMRDGVKNDRYEHGWIRTIPEYEEWQHRNDLKVQLKAHGIIVDRDIIPTDKLEAILYVLKDGE